MTMLLSKKTFRCYFVERKILLDLDARWEKRANIFYLANRAFSETNIVMQRIFCSHKNSKPCCISSFKVRAGWVALSDKNPKFSVVFTFPTCGLCLSKFNLHHFADLHVDRLVHLICLISHAKYILSATTYNTALREWSSE